MNILKNISSRLLYTLLLISIISTLTSCFGFYQQDLDVPIISGISVIGDSAEALQIQLTWNAVEGSGGYNVYRTVSASGTYTYAGSTGSGQLTYIDADEDLELGESYTYKVNSYGLWHTKEKESAKSAPSGAVEYFLLPVWKTIHMVSGSLVAIRTALVNANTLFFVYADSTGKLHVGRILAEEDPDNEENTIYTVDEMVDATFTSMVNSADPDFDIIYAGSDLYIGFADYNSTDPSHADSEKLSVQKISVDDAEDDSDVLDWKHSYIGERRFSTYPVSSVSMASGRFGASSYLYAGYIRETAGHPPTSNVLAVRSKLLTTPIASWGDISPVKATHYSSIAPEFSHILMENGTLTVAFNPDADDLYLLSRIDNDTGENWVETDPNLPAFSPTGQHFSALASDDGTLTIFSYNKSNDSWNIREKGDATWSIINDDTGFSTASSDFTSPFAAVSATAAAMGTDNGRNFLLGSTSSGPKVLMYDQKLYKWFSYGNPGGSDSIESPQLVVSTGVEPKTYYAAWIEGSTAHISIGR